MNRFFREFLDSLSTDRHKDAEPNHISLAITPTAVAESAFIPIEVLHLVGEEKR